MKPAQVIMGWEQHGSRVMLIRKGRGGLELIGRQKGRPEQRLGEWSPLQLVEALNVYHRTVDAMKVVACA